MNNPKQEGQDVTLAPMVMPAVSPVQAIEAWKAYQEMKQTVKTKEDVQIIDGREFLKKSYWRKIATFFNLSVEFVKEEKEVFEGGDMAFHFIAKAIAPNGRFAIGAGSCNLLEKGRRNTIHNARATAETRASNRAISNLVGGGEVSAEEADRIEETKEVIENKVNNGNDNDYKCRFCGTVGKFHKKDCPNGVTLKTNPEFGADDISAVNNIMGEASYPIA